MSNFKTAAVDDADRKLLKAIGSCVGIVKPAGPRIVPFREAALKLSTGPSNVHSTTNATVFYPSTECIRSIGSCLRPGPPSRRIT